MFNIPIIKCFTRSNSEPLIMCKHYESVSDVGQKVKRWPLLSNLRSSHISTNCKSSHVLIEIKSLY